MARSTALNVERLEDRLAPATFGNPWPDAGHLTLSFPADGTQVGNKQSELFRILDAQAPRSAWQLAVLKAFQTWAVQGNLNVSVVADGGQPFGSRGPVQTDPRFGDIRLAAYPFAAQTGTLEDVAIGSPFDVTAGTWSGDIKLNSANAFGLNQPNKYDLYTVMLHEIGHALGLDHSANPASVMYETYGGVRTGLSTEDIAALQALYGARTADQYEGSAGNETFSTAKSLVLLNSSSGLASAEANGDITTLQDKDVYKFTTPLNAGSLTIELKSANVSLLTSRVTVYDSAKTVVGSAIALNPLNGNLTIQVPSVKVLSTYYVKVEGNVTDVFGMGAYRLKIKSLPITSVVSNLLDSTVDTATSLLNADLHTNDSFLTALLLPQLVPQADARFDYVFKGSIEDSRDVDIYKIKAPAAVNGSPVVMSAMIWGLEKSTLIPRVTVYDANQKVVSASVLVNDGGTYTIQVPNVTPGATYYVKAAAADPQGSANIGNYFLGVDFGAKAVHFDSYATGNLDQSKSQSGSGLTMTKSQLFHFVLSADTADPTVDSAVRLTVYDSTGKVLLSFVANAGQTVTRDLFLSRGTYLVRYAAATQTKVSLPRLTYRLAGLALSDPVGPETDDPTADPAGSSSPSSGDGSSYYWWSDNSTWGGDNNGLSPQDPYSDPYSYA